MKKSSIGGKKYLAYLWELGGLPIYIIGGLAYSVSLGYHGLATVQTEGIYMLATPVASSSVLSGIVIEDHRRDIRHWWK